MNDHHLLSGVTYYFRVSGMPEAPNGPESGSAVFILFEDASGYPVFDVDVRLVKATIGRRGQVTLHGTTTATRLVKPRPNAAPGSTSPLPNASAVA